MRITCRRLIIVVLTLLIPAQLRAQSDATLPVRPPGNIVGSPTFGKITRTRFPTGEAGSSRQAQLAVRLMV